MLAHLQAMTWRFRAQGQLIWAIAPYSEPVRQTNGTVRYRPRRAAETGNEGWACVDDAARAALLALQIAERAIHKDGVPDDTGQRALRWARRWLSLVRYMQLSDGRFVNFVLDSQGRRNLSGPTSLPGGVWWTGRALWALARYHRLTHSRWALESWLRCPFPDLGNAGKTLGLFILAACELLRADPSSLSPWLGKRLSSEQQRLGPLVEQWAGAIVQSGSHYFRDEPGRADLPLWGYHQLDAIATAARILSRPEWIEPCRDTVRYLARPVIAARGIYHWDPAHGSTKEGLCVYCLSPLVQGLMSLHQLTGDTPYQQLARDAIAWLYGRNDAHAVLYDPLTGRCADGLDGPDATKPSNNYGAESSIEAGFMEMAFRNLPLGMRH